MSLIHTCYRITDIDRSVAFYNALGFKEVGRLPIRDEAINVFMNQPEDGDNPLLELTYNVGHTEPYEMGTGYGHIAITSGDLDGMLAALAAALVPALARAEDPVAALAHRIDGMLAALAEQGIEPERPPYTIREGGSRLCFVRDPDGYRIEILERG